MSHFEVRKAAHAVALIIRERGGKLDLIDTIKLAYMADREALNRFGLPIMNDTLANLPFGPVNSRTYNYAKKEGHEQEVWDTYIDRAGNTLIATGAGDRERFNRLSRAEQKIIADVVARFTDADLKKWKLVEWIHKNCEEWVDPQGSSTPLHYHKVFEALKKKNPEDLAANVQKAFNLREALAKIQ